MVYVPLKTLTCSVFSIVFWSVADVKDAMHILVPVHFPDVLCSCQDEALVADRI